jgi:UDP:flavonoid glycosyltransferase YjiC (YdhE family)
MKNFAEKPGSKGRLLIHKRFTFILGLIYIAFGTYANWSVALPNVLESIHFTIKNLPDYQILFSYNGDSEKMPKVKNLMTVKWAPQSAILLHPKTVLFVSHGGLKVCFESCS